MKTVLLRRGRCDKNAAYFNELHALNTYILSLRGRVALSDEHENRISEILSTFPLQGSGIQDLRELYNLISEINGELFRIDSVRRAQRIIWDSFFTGQYRDRDRAFEFSRQPGIHPQILTESVTECTDYDMQRAIEIADRIPILESTYRSRAYADITLAVLQMPGQIERAIQYASRIPTRDPDSAVDSARAFSALVLALARMPGQIERAIQWANRIPTTPIQARIRAYNVIANILIDQHRASSALIMACSIPPELRTEELISTIERANRRLSRYPGQM